jgi:DNA modification methylase
VTVRILIGDCREKLRELPDASVNCCVTSPPYFGLRDYGVDGQMGLEPTPDEFVAGMVEVFRDVRRVLRDDGTLWLNIGDSYANTGNANPTMGKSTLRPHGGKGEHEKSKHRPQPVKTIPQGVKQKDLLGIPWMLAFALRADGWYLRQDIIWSKPNPMPESVRDRCTKAHEYLFLLSKGARYYFDAKAICEPSVIGEGAVRNITPGKKGQASARNDDDRFGVVNDGTRNKRSVWEVATQPFSEAHFATYPPALIEPCILAGCPKGGTVLDPFGGAGTTGLVADRLQRDAILIELNPEYAEIARKRISTEAGMFGDIKVAA